jgi:hypothetical protein
MRKRTVIVNDKMQKNYRYVCSEPIGRNFDPAFTPDLTPQEKLRLGVFGGKYMTDSRAEFPRSWFARANPALNFFGVDASQPLSRSGGTRAGCTRTIRAAGYNGIAATQWAAACPRRTAA